MPTEITVAIIGLIGIILSAAISSMATRNAVMNEISKSLAVLETKLSVQMDEMKKDLAEHNHYAKLFSETVPVMQEQIKELNRRIDENRK